MSCYSRVTQSKPSIPLFPFFFGACLSPCWWQAHTFFETSIMAYIELLTVAAKLSQLLSVLTPLTVHSRSHQLALNSAALTTLHSPAVSCQQTSNTAALTMPHSPTASLPASTSCFSTCITTHIVYTCISFSDSHITLKVIHCIFCIGQWKSCIQ